VGRKREDHRRATNKGILQAGPTMALCNFKALGVVVGLEPKPDVHSDNLESSREV
jgi:hypothetical protein